MRKTTLSLAAALLLAGTAAQAQSLFNAQASMHDNLALLLAAKKPVTVILDSGEKYQASIGSLGDHFVVLTQPAQKEFFDVLIPLDKIVAVEARVR